MKAKGYRKTVFDLVSSGGFCERKREKVARGWSQGCRGARLVTRSANNDSKKIRRRSVEVRKLDGDDEGNKRG